VKLLLAVLAAYVLYAGIFFLAQRRLMYPGTYLARVSPDAQPPLSAQRLWLETSSGNVEAWFFGPASPAPAPAMIFAHGNGEVIDYWPDVMQMFADRGVAVLLVEYPGYGRSDGKPTQKAIAEAFTAAYDWLASRHDVDARRISGMGRSLGGGAVADLSRSRPLASLVLTSTFSSVRDIAWRGYFLPGFLALDPFDNRGAVAGFDGPVLVIHGRRDDQLPFRHAEALAGASPRSELVALECGHNDCPPAWPPFVERVSDFVLTAAPID
jgi:fermentation-respiration switch protein FrsA (DUF1100 family)